MVRFIFFVILGAEPSLYSGVGTVAPEPRRVSFFNTEKTGKRHGFSGRRQRGASIIHRSKHPKLLPFREGSRLFPVFSVLRRCFLSVGKSTDEHQRRTSEFEMCESCRA